MKDKIIIGILVLLLVAAVLGIVLSLDKSMESGSFNNRSTASSGTPPQETPAAHFTETETPTPQGSPEPKETLQMDNFRLNSYLVLGGYGRFIDVFEQLQESYTLSGDEIFISFGFNSRIATEVFQKNLTLLSDGEAILPEIEQYQGTEGISVFMLTLKTEKARSRITLQISKELHDMAGNALSDDISFEILQHKPTTVKYALAGGESEPLEAYAWDFDREFSWLELTAGTKEFHLKFSADVNRESVEESIKAACIADKLTCSFQWQSPDELVLTLEGLKQNENEYRISMESAVDISGNKIMESLYFKASAANKMGYIDLQQCTTHILEEFSDRKVLPYLSDHTEDFLLLYDSWYKEEYIYALKDGKMQKSGMSLSDYRNLEGLNWLDGSQALVYDESGKKIVKVSLKDQSSVTLADLSSLNRIADTYVTINEIKLSSDQSKLAFISGEYPEKPRLWIYSFRDGKFENFPFETTYIHWPMPCVFADLHWIDNQYIQFTEATYNQSQNMSDNHTIKLNTSNGERTIVVSGTLQAYSEDHQMYVVSRPVPWKYGIAYRYYLQKNGTETLINGNDPAEAEDSRTLLNFVFKDSRTLLYNEEKPGEPSIYSVVRYDLDTGLEETIGSGRIVGMDSNGSLITAEGPDHATVNRITVTDQEGNRKSIELENYALIGFSKDKTRLYFLTNLTMFYNIP